MIVIIIIHIDHFKLHNNFHGFNHAGNRSNCRPSWNEVTLTSLLTLVVTQHVAGVVLGVGNFSGCGNLIRSASANLSSGRARPACIVASWSSSATAARGGVAVETEVIHCSISIADPLSSLASVLEKSNWSWKFGPALPFFLCKSCNCTAILATSAAQRGWRVTSSRCSHTSQATSKAFWTRR